MTLGGTEIEKAPAVYRESLTKLSAKGDIPEVKWGSVGADMTVLPLTMGPVDTYRPLYKIEETKKVRGKGEGFSEREAVLNALYNACESAKCDYIAAAQQQVRTIKRGDVLAFEVTVIGFPVTLTGVQTVKASFYEQQSNGSVKKLEAPENRYTFTTNGTWVAGEINGTKGISLKSSLAKKDMDMTIQGTGSVTVAKTATETKMENGKVVDRSNSAMSSTIPVKLPFDLK